MDGNGTGIGAGEGDREGTGEATYLGSGNIDPTVVPVATVAPINGRYRHRDHELRKVARVTITFVDGWQETINLPEARRGMYRRSRNHRPDVSGRYSDDDAYVSVELRWTEDVDG